MFQYRGTKRRYENSDPTISFEQPSVRTALLATQRPFHEDTLRANAKRPSEESSINPTLAGDGMPTWVAVNESRRRYCRRLCGQLSRITRAVVSIPSRRGADARILSPFQLR